jgi:hypothetical protein
MFLGSKVRPVCKADSLAAICEPIVYTMWECYNSIGQGTRGSIVVKALWYKLEGRRFETQWGEFLNLPNPSGRSRPWVYSASNRNEYEKQNNNVSGE